MNLDRKRHKLLELLTKQRKNVELKKNGFDTLGVPFKILLEELNCNEDQLHSITSELYSSDEIKYHDANQVIGLYVRPLGMTAFTNKKYLKRINTRIKDIIKFWIAIIAIAISLGSFYISKVKNISNSAFDKESKELKLKIDTMETQLKEMKLEFNNRLKFGTKKDSLLMENKKNHSNE
ncbi:hypothetical protein [Tenacibaculum aiptasiae]|uniref:hypothetical protein n=1 Tax=Tenacibaculum aiptasiae TaxID=426481 RepID=UPI003B5CE5C0